MKEREIASKFRSSLQKAYFDNIDVVPIYDSYNTGKKPYDFHTVYVDAEFEIPIYTAWEAKIIDGITFNFNKIRPYQLKTFNFYNLYSNNTYLFAIFIKNKDVAIVDKETYEYFYRDGKIKFQDGGKYHFICKNKLDKEVFVKKIHYAKYYEWDFYNFLNIIV